VFYGTDPWSTWPIHIRYVDPWPADPLSALMLIVFVLQVGISTPYQTNSINVLKELRVCVIYFPAGQRVVRVSLICIPIIINPWREGIWPTLLVDPGPEFRGSRGERTAASSWTPFCIITTRRLAHFVLKSVDFD